jgi:hypothetical protein
MIQGDESEDSASNPPSRRGVADGRIGDDVLGVAPLEAVVDDSIVEVTISVEVGILAERVSVDGWSVRVELSVEDETVVSGVLAGDSVLVVVSLEKSVVDIETDVEDSVEIDGSEDVGESVRVCESVDVSTVEDIVGASVLWSSVEGRALVVGRSMDDSVVVGSAGKDVPLVVIAFVD